MKKIQLELYQLDQETTQLSSDVTSNGGWAPGHGRLEVFLGSRLGIISFGHAMGLLQPWCWSKSRVAVPRNRNLIYCSYSFMILKQIPICIMSSTLLL